jgi:hypothetical protein
MRPTATDAGTTRDCDPRVPARRGKMPAVMTADMPAPAGMTAEMFAATGMAAEMSVPSPAGTMATTVAAPMATTVATPMTAAAFWARQRETRQRNRENGDRNDA